MSINIYWEDLVPGTVRDLGSVSVTAEDIKEFAEQFDPQPFHIDELAGKSFYVQFSQEQFRLMDQDVVVMYGSQDDILANPVFKRLDAVKEDRVIYVDIDDEFAGALGFSSALSLPFLLDQSEDMFAAAVDGDPATKVTQPE